MPVFGLVKYLSIHAVLTFCDIKIYYYFNVHVCWINTKSSCAWQILSQIVRISLGMKQLLDVQAQEVYLIRICWSFSEMLWQGQSIWGEGQKWIWEYLCEGKSQGLGKRWLIKQPTRLVKTHGPRDFDNF